MSVLLHSFLFHLFSCGILVAIGDFFFSLYDLETVIHTVFLCSGLSFRGTGSGSCEREKFAYLGARRQTTSFFCLLRRAEEAPLFSLLTSGAVPFPVDWLRLAHTFSALLSFAGSLSFPSPFFPLLISIIIVPGPFF